jgi:hypothetical protein
MTFDICSIYEVLVQILSRIYAVVGQHFPFGGIRDSRWNLNNLMKHCCVPKKKRPKIAQKVQKA